MTVVKGRPRRVVRAECTSSAFVIKVAAPVPTSYRNCLVYPELTHHYAGLELFCWELFVLFVQVRLLA